MSILVYRDHEIDETGVTRVWAWECPDDKCYQRGHYGGSSLFWETAIRSANQHIAYHRAVAWNA